MNQNTTNHNKNTIHCNLGKTNYFKPHAINKTIFLLTLIVLASFTNATILASAYTDKPNLGENEVGFLTVKIMNDSTITEQNIYLRVQADEGILFIQGLDEQKNFIQTIESIKQNEIKEMRIKIKSNSTLAKNANIYAYFGKDTSPKQAAVTTISLEKLPTEIKATIQKNENDTATVDFTLKNTAKTPITNASAELIAASGFDIQTPPLIEDKISPQGELNQKFKVMLPLTANGDQKMLIAYGYFDDKNTPHYFEKMVTVNLFKPNYALIGLIGFAILIGAAYLFLRKSDDKDAKKEKIKGTGQKE